MAKNHREGLSASAGSAGFVGKAGLSRRSFVRAAAGGAVGTALMLGGRGARAAGKDAGEITLDVLLLTYFSAPLGSRESSTWTFETRYATTMTLRSLTSPELVLKAKVVPEQERVSGSSAVEQMQSAKVGKGLSLLPRPRRNESLSVTTPTPGVPENTVYFGLLKPRLRVKGNGDKAQFRLVQAATSFTLKAEDLREFAGLQTAASITSQYVTDPAALIEPRYIPVSSIDSGSHQFTGRAEADDANPVTAAVTSQIIGQSGFESEELQQAFAVGNQLEVTYHSTPEAEGNILRMETTIDRTRPGVTRVYWDRVFKTFVLTDAG